MTTVMRRLTLALLLVLGLAACAAEPVSAPPAAIEAARYQHPGPTTLTLFTGIKSSSGSSSHSALMVSGSERVIFDPAGTFKHETVVEHNDVIHGATPELVWTYLNYHVRPAFSMYRQDIVVSPEVAEAALRAVRSYGAVPKAHCSQAVTDILEDLPGFEGFPRNWYPTKTRKAFARYAGVSERFYVHDPNAANSIMLAQPR